MLNLIPKFGEAGAPSGIGAFNINLKSFLFQLVTFVLVLIVLKRWVLPPLISTMEKRRETLEKSLLDAKQTEELLSKAEITAEEILAKARVQADEALAETKKAARGIIADAETAAGERATIIVREAEARLGEERDKLRSELRAELAELVADATAKIINEKLDTKKDMSLIERAIRSVAG